MFASLCIVFFSSTVQAQKTVVTDSSEKGFRTVIPGIEYRKSKTYQFFWGDQYRKEWTTPVRVPIVDLASIYGGLKPIEQGGGRQTLTLRLEDSKGKQYVLRSIDKKYSKSLPKIVAGSFVEDIANDEVSTAHPFAAVTIPPMIEAAGIYHTNPLIVYVPSSPVLGKYNADFANTLCLLEERPDDNQEDAANFGFSEDVKGTEKMFKKFYAESDHRVDQRAFVKARLFDMFLGDWGRHDDQWRWATFDSAGNTIYKPIPRDRDQAYTKFNGFIVKKVLGNEELEHVRSFSSKIKNIKKYNFPARYIDRQLTNEVTNAEWIAIAEELKTKLTDAVIDSAVRKMPPEMFRISGPSIIAKLKQRRDDLTDYAARYYRFLNKEVEVVGTSKAEQFTLTPVGDHLEKLELFDLKKDGELKKTPFYSRIFDDRETNELRLYGLAGEDIFRLDSGVSNIRIRVIGSIDHDSIVNESSHRIKVYDNPGDAISGKVNDHLSSDTSINSYNYNAFKYNSGHVVKMPFYSNTRGIHILGGYTYTRQQWRKQPFGWKQTLQANYSITNRSLGADYNAFFNEAIGKWSIVINGAYDQRLKNYYFGQGNETPYTKDLQHYEYGNEEGTASLGLNRVFGTYNSFTLSGLFQYVRVREETGKLLSSTLPNNPAVFDSKRFGGVRAAYSYYHVNNLVVPTKGFGISADVTYLSNLSNTDRHIVDYNINGGFYLPFSKQFSLAVRTGAGTVTGDPEFYQLH